MSIGRWPERVTREPYCRRGAWSERVTVECCARITAIRKLRLSHSCRCDGGSAMTSHSIQGLLSENPISGLPTSRPPSTGSAGVTVSLAIRLVPGAMLARRRRQCGDADLGLTLRASDVAQVPRIHFSSCPNSRSRHRGDHGDFHAHTPGDVRSLPVTRPEQLWRIGDFDGCCFSNGYTQGNGDLLPHGLRNFLGSSRYDQFPFYVIRGEDSALKHTSDHVHHAR